LEDVIKSISKLDAADGRDSLVTKGSKKKSMMKSKDSTPCPEPFKHPNILPVQQIFQTKQSTQEKLDSGD
jgi:hypothetical protein